MLRVLARLQGYDRLTWLTYDRAEYLANVALFVPVGLFLLLLFGTRFWWLAVAAAARDDLVDRDGAAYDPRPGVRRARHRRQHHGGGGSVSRSASCSPCRPRCGAGASEDGGGGSRLAAAGRSRTSAWISPAARTRTWRPRSPRRRCRSGRRARRRSVRQVARPMPVPSIESSTRARGSKTRCRSAGGTPRPLSVISIRHARCTCRAAMCTSSGRSSRAVADGVPEQVLQHGSELGAVAQHRGQPADVQRDVGELGGEVLEHLAEHEVEVHLGRPEGAAEAGVVEDVVDQVRHPRRDVDGAVEER